MGGCRGEDLVHFRLGINSQAGRPSNLLKQVREKKTLRSLDDWLILFFQAASQILWYWLTG